MSLINNRKRRGGWIWGYPPSKRAQKRRAILKNGEPEEIFTIFRNRYTRGDDGIRRVDDRSTGNPSYRANPNSVAEISKKYFANKQYQRPPTSRPPPKPPEPTFYSSYAAEPERIKKMREIDIHNMNPKNHGNMRSYAELEPYEPLWKREDREKRDQEFEEKWKKWPSPYTENPSELSIGERLRDRQNRPWREKDRREELKREEQRKEDQKENDRKIKQLTDNIEKFVKEHTEKIKELPDQIIELPNNLMSRINNILGIGKGGKKRKPKKTLQKRKKTIRNFPKQNQKKQKKIYQKKL